MKAFLGRLFRGVPLPIARTLVGLLHPSFNISVVGLFFARDGKVLILRHVYRHSYPWGLPAGFLKAGEDPAIAMAREVKEEIGLDVSVERVIAAHPVRRRHMEIVVLGRADSTQAMQPNYEIFEGAFVAVEDFPADMMPSQQAMARRFKASAAPSLKTQA